MAGPWEDYQRTAPSPPPAGAGPWDDYAKPAKKPLEPNGIKQGGQAAEPAGPWQDYAPAAPSPPKITVPPATPLKPITESQWQANDKAFQAQVAAEENANRASNLQAIDAELRKSKDTARRDILLKERKRILGGEDLKGPAVSARYRNPKPVDLPGQNRFYDFYENQVTPFVKQTVPAIAENALSMGSGMLAAPVAGLAGMAALPVPGVQAGDVVRRVQEGLTYAPRTQKGQKHAEDLGTAMGYLSKPAEAAGEALADRGYPNAGVVARTALDPMSWLAVVPAALPRGGPPIRPGAAPQVPWSGLYRGPGGPGNFVMRAPENMLPQPPMGGRVEPPVGPLPQPPRPEFDPLDPRARTTQTMDRRPDPALGGLPEPPKPEFGPVDVTQPVGGVEFERIPPSGRAIPREAPPTPEGTIRVGEEPPVGVGGKTVRYYHGGSPEGDGPLWFTSDLQDAQGWAARDPNMQVWYVDLPENSPLRGGDPQFGVQPPTRIELPADIAAQRQQLGGLPKPAEQVRALEPETSRIAEPGDPLDSYFTHHANMLDAMRTSGRITEEEYNIGMRLLAEDMQRHVQPRLYTLEQLRERAFDEGSQNDFVPGMQRGPAPAQPPTPAAPGHTNRLDFTGQTVTQGPELPRPPYEPPTPKGELPLRPRYDDIGPDDVLSGVHVVEDTSRRVGGTETGAGYKHKQTIGFVNKVEEYLFKSASGGEQADTWFSLLQDRVRNLEPGEAQYGNLARMTIPELKREAMRYRDQVRAQAEAKARDNEGQQTSIKAQPYDASRYEKPPPPTSPFGEGGLPLPPKGGAPVEPAPMPPRPPFGESGLPLPKPVEKPLAPLEPKPRDPRLVESDALYERAMDLAKSQLDRGFISRQEFDARSKRHGMERAARERQITGKLTGKEQAAKDAREASNYKGKEVSAGGRDGVVKNMSFGKVRVEFDDGTVQSFLPEEVQPRGTRTFAKARTEGKGPLDTTVDSITTAISKLGGLSRDQMRDLVGDTKGSYKTASGLSVFRKGGADIDTMLQRLYEHGYISEEQWQLDNGKSFLEMAVPDEINGTGKHYSLAGNEEARFNRMREEAGGDLGPGTLSANPMFNPRAMKQVLGMLREGVQLVTGLTDVGQVGPGAGARGQGIAWRYDALVDGARQTAMNDMAAVKRWELAQQPSSRFRVRPEDVATIAAIESENASLRTLATQRLGHRWAQELLDFGDNPPRSVKTQVIENEKYRRMLAREGFQRQLIAEGEAVNAMELLKTHQELPMWATRLPDGRYLQIANKSYKIVKQFVQAHDPMAFEQQSKLWRAVVSGMQGAVSFTMLNPFFHMFTVGSRMVPFQAKANPWWTPESHARANANLNNRTWLQQMRADGYKQFPVRETDLPMGSTTGTVERLMSKTKATQFAYNMHLLGHNLMANRVNHWQAMFYEMTKADLIKAGMPDKAAHLTAIRKANTMAGNLSKAEMIPGVYKAMGGLFFSRGYTSTVLRQLTRAVAHDKTLQAALKQNGFTPEQAIKFMKQNRDDFAAALVRDYLAYQISMQAMNYAMTAYHNEEDKNGNTGGHFTWDNKGSEGLGDVIVPTRAFLWRGEDGYGVYMRAPFRTTLDMLLFMQQAPEILHGERPEWVTHKMHPYIRGGLQHYSQEHGGGQPMGDTPATVANIIESAGPPLGDLAFVGAESYRQGNAKYLGSYLNGILNYATNHPISMMGNIAGFQVRVVNPYYEERRGSEHIYRERDVVNKRANQLNKNWDNMSDEMRERAQEEIQKKARKLHMPAPPLGGPRPPGAGTRGALEERRNEEEEEE